MNSNSHEFLSGINVEMNNELRFFSRPKTTFFGSMKSCPMDADCDCPMKCPLSSRHFTVQSAPNLTTVHHNEAFPAIRQHTIWLCVCRPPTHTTRWCAVTHDVGFVQRVAREVG